MKQRILLFTFLSAFFLALPTQAQVAKDHPLHQEMLQFDSLVFDVGFNTCEFKVYYDIIDENLEFYHDQSGITLGQKDFIENTERNLCSLPYRPLRKGLKDSFEVFPMYNNGELYGAIQKGIHEFYAVEKDSTYHTSTASFTHLWIKKEGKWKLKNVLSYNHRSPGQD